MKSITTCWYTWFLDASLKQFVIVGCSISSRGRHVFYHEVYARKKHGNEAGAMRALETLNHRFNSVLATESLNHQSVQLFYGKHFRNRLLLICFTYPNYFLKLLIKNFLIKNISWYLIVWSNLWYNKVFFKIEYDQTIN